jgi:hypothetical protein
VKDLTQAGGGGAGLVGAGAGLEGGGAKGLGGAPTPPVPEKWATGDSSVIWSYTPELTCS